MHMLGGMAAAETRGTPFAAVLPNCYLMPCPGMPPSAPAGFPPTGRWAASASPH